MLIVRVVARDIFNIILDGLSKTNPKLSREELTSLYNRQKKQEYAAWDGETIHTLRRKIGVLKGSYPKASETELTRRLGAQKTGQKFIP